MASCNAFVAASIVSAELDASCKIFSRSAIAVATAGSCEIGAVLPSNALAASRAASISLLAAVKVSCNAFVAASISAVRSVALSLAAAAITSCNFCTASCTALSV